MGFMHINNLYKYQDVLLFKQVYAMEKIHGSSSFLHWINGEVKPFSGGAKHESFLNIFDGINAPTLESIKNQFNIEFGTQTEVFIYGEVYGGNMQAMKETYGNILKFIAFDVKVSDYFVSVPTAERIVKNFNLEFVDYVLVDANIESLDKERLKESTQAIRNGCGNGKKREGIVIRPPIEIYKNGERVIAKYKNEDFEERKTPQKVVDPNDIKVLDGANKIADEWVTAERLRHVLDKIFINGAELNIEKTGDVVKAMIEDVTREAAGEIIDSKVVRVTISKKTAQMFKLLISDKLRS